jgi:HD-GYP domain-containing protein (c-di-GMP phosphodiesterase class II)
VSIADTDNTNGEPTDLESVSELEELAQEEPAPTLQIPADASVAAEVWKLGYRDNSIPCLLLDRSLRIIQANPAFCALFDCGDRVAGVYFTQFYSSSFDARKSAELFRAVRSAETGYEWHGMVERTGTDQLLNVSKVWIQPAGGIAGSTPAAYTALCLDMTAEHRQLLQGTFTSLLGAARLKDNDTGNHIERVNLYSRVLAEEMDGTDGTPRLDRQFQDTIGLVAALHDVGKIGTPDDILNKAGQLEAWEWAVMKQHTINGAYILSTYPSPMAREIALHHHERWDGTGYPMGLSGELIPVSARIVALADVYDALRMRRAYKSAYTHEQAVESVAGERGTHFDPALVDRFMRVGESFRRIFSDLADPV